MHAVDKISVPLELPVVKVRQGFLENQENKAPKDLQVLMESSHR